MAAPSSLPVSVLVPPLPPRYDEYRSRVPSAFSFATNASEGPRTLCVGWNASRTGKKSEDVVPTTYALPAVSTAIPDPLSLPSP